MNETLQSKLARLLADEHIYRVDINIKCKTQDGMIYTLFSQNHTRVEETQEPNIPFADLVYSSVAECLLHVMEVVEKGDGYWFSVEEMVAVKHTEIIRLWAELGDLYSDAMPQNV